MVTRKTNKIQAVLYSKANTDCNDPITHLLATEDEGGLKFSYLGEYKTEEITGSAEEQPNCPKWCAISFESPEQEPDIKTAREHYTMAHTTDEIQNNSGSLRKQDIQVCVNCTQIFKTKYFARHSCERHRDIDTKIATPNDLENHGPR